MRLLIFLMIFVVLFSLLIISNNNLAMQKSENLVKFGDLWISWLDKVSKNVGSLTGNLIKMDWNP